MRREVLDLTKDPEHELDCAIFGHAIERAFLNPNRTKITIIRGDTIATNRAKENSVKRKAKGV